MTAVWIVLGLIGLIVVALAVRIVRLEIREARFAKLQQDINQEID